MDYTAKLSESSSTGWFALHRVANVDTLEEGTILAMTTLGNNVVVFQTANKVTFGTAHIRVLQGSAIIISGRVGVPPRIAHNYVNISITTVRFPTMSELVTYEKCMTI